MSLTGIINEEWRNVSGYANYQVSNIGRVRNVKTERILKPKNRKDGYYQICLCEDSKPKYYRIYRSLLKSLLKCPIAKNLVDHMNYSKSDNTILNLRWVSTSENL